MFRALRGFPESQRGRVTSHSLETPCHMAMTATGWSRHWPPEAPAQGRSKVSPCIALPCYGLPDHAVASAQQFQCCIRRERLQVGQIVASPL